MAKVLELPAEQRIVLRGVSWETYEWLLADHEQRGVPHFTYDRGTLEIMSPLPVHEMLNRRIAQLVLAVAEGADLDVEDLGSTTFRREDLQRGFEPDSCFYFRDAKRIRGKKRLDLTVDPPPELVVEIDITSPSLDKLPIYAQLGVSEVWRYDGEKVAIFKLGDEEYAEAAESYVLPLLTGDIITGFIEKSASLERPAWMREVRRWAQEHGASRG